MNERNKVSSENSEKLQIKKFGEYSNLRKIAQNYRNLSQVVCRLVCHFDIFGVGGWKKAWKTLEKQ
jgi:hypothetical protein